MNFTLWTFLPGQAVMGAALDVEDPGDIQIETLHVSRIVVFQTRNLADPSQKSSSLVFSRSEYGRTNQRPLGRKR